VTALERGVTGGLAALRAGVAGLDSAKQRDMRSRAGSSSCRRSTRRRSGWRFFAPSAVAQFQRALYWTQLARAHMPRVCCHAPTRTAAARRSGSTRALSTRARAAGFLLRAAELSFLLDPTAPQPKRYAGRLTGLTNDPALYGRPTLFAASAPAVSAGAMLDHVHATARDNRWRDGAGGAPPGDPIGIAADGAGPGQGTTQARLRAAGRHDSRSLGDPLHARAVVPRLGNAGSTGADLLWRTLSGISDLQVDAGVTGTLRQPRLSVRSNLDEAIAARLRAMLGEEVAAAQRRLRPKWIVTWTRRSRRVRGRVASAPDRDHRAPGAATRAAPTRRKKTWKAGCAELTRIRLP